MKRKKNPNNLLYKFSSINSFFHMGWSGSPRRKKKKTPHWRGRKETGTKSSALAPEDEEEETSLAWRAPRVANFQSFCFVFHAICLVWISSVVQSITRGVQDLKSVFHGLCTKPISFFLWKRSKWTRNKSNCSSRWLHRCSAKLMMMTMMMMMINHEDLLTAALSASRHLWESEPKVHKTNRYNSYDDHNAHDWCLMMMVMPLVIAGQNEEEEEEEEKYRRRVVGPEALPCFVLMCLGAGGSSLSDRHWKNKEEPRALHLLDCKNWLRFFSSVFTGTCTHCNLTSDGWQALRPA